MSSHTNAISRYLLPGIAFATVALVLALSAGKDPRLLDSPVITDKTLPRFELTRLHDATQRMSDKDLRGRVSMLNVWASWCQPCRQEHGMLMQIVRETDIPIYGLNYQDNRENAIRWLNQLGDPYVLNGFDNDGKVALALGAYGAPETYVINKQGTIAYKHIGRLTESVWQQTLRPIIDALRNGDN